MLWETCSLLCRTPEISEYLKILWLTSGSQRPTFVIASAVFKYSGTWGSLQWFSRPHRRLAFVQISTETPLDSSSSTIQTIALLLLLPPCLLRGHGQSITFDLTSLNGSYTVKPNGTHIFLKIKHVPFLFRDCTWPHRSLCMKIIALPSMDVWVQMHVLHHIIVENGRSVCAF